MGKPCLSICNTKITKAAPKTLREDLKNKDLKRVVVQAARSDAHAGPLLVFALSAGRVAQSTQDDDEGREIKMGTWVHNISLHFMTGRSLHGTEEEADEGCRAISRFQACVGISY